MSERLRRLVETCLRDGTGEPWTSAAAEALAENERLRAELEAARAAVEAARHLGDSACPDHAVVMGWCDTCQADNAAAESLHDALAHYDAARDGREEE